MHLLLIARAENQRSPISPAAGGVFAGRIYARLQARIEMQIAGIRDANPPPGR